MKEKSAIEKLLDENNNENIVLFDENDNATEFEQVALIPLEDKTYAILKPVTKIKDVNDDEAFVFVLEEGEDEDVLEICTDPKIIDEVFNEYYDLLKEEGYKTV